MAEHDYNFDKLNIIYNVNDLEYPTKIEMKDSSKNVTISFNVVRLEDKIWLEVTPEMEEDLLKYAGITLKELFNRFYLVKIVTEENSKSYFISTENWNKMMMLKGNSQPSKFLLDEVIETYKKYYPDIDFHKLAQRHYWR